MPVPSPPLPFQPGLFDAPAVSFDATFSRLERRQLDAESWVDFASGWVSGADQLFEELLRTRDWSQRTRYMYERRVLEPRLTSSWNFSSGAPLEPATLDGMRVALGAHYGVTFDSIGFNLYRDGQDSVAWHGDHIAREIAEPIVVLVSLGEPRRFLLRPKGGGRSLPYLFQSGDLLVTGGRTQRTWDHSIPKVAHAGPRISLAFRYGLDSRAYAGKRVAVEP